MSALSDDKIPNNVNLAGDRRLQRALEQWQPSFLKWWHDVGPIGTAATDVYLRTAISVEAGGWAHFDYVKMPDYRWGIFLAEPVPGRTIGFGEKLGQPAWQEVPGEHRADLRRLIVVQGDTEPASVEQQRHLGQTSPSLYDLRNLFQINVEEGRHLWAIGVDSDEYFTVLETSYYEPDGSGGPDPRRWQPHILTSMLKRFDVVTRDLLVQFARDEFEGGDRGADPVDERPRQAFSAGGTRRRRCAIHPARSACGG